MTGRLPVLLAAIAVLALAPGPVEAAEAPLPTADELVDKVLDWVAARHAEKPRYFYERIADVEKLDRHGKVEKRERRLYRSVELDGETFGRLVSVDGRELNDDEREDEKKREKKWREERAERKKKEKDPFFSRKLADRYRFRVIGRETLRGRPVFVATFEPDTSKELPEKEDEDRFLNALTGKFWVDAEEYAIVRIDARLTRTIRFGLGLAAYFKKLSLRFEQRRAPDGDWFPHKMKMYAWGRTLVFKPIRRREESRFVNVRRLR